MGDREEIVAYCRGVIGCAYDYTPSGGVEGQSYNCSFLSTCAYKAAGLTIPGWQGHQNGDGSQSDWVYRSGHWTSDMSMLQPGDLVFFGDSRTYTTHVGVVSKSGSTPYIIDSTPLRGVAERKLPSGAGFVGGGWPLKEMPEDGQLEVDGYIGELTVTLWQGKMGTTQDGIISGQDKAREALYPRLKAVKYGGGGSNLVKAVQKMFNLTQTGIIDAGLVARLQSWLAFRGYDVTADNACRLGVATAKGLQSSLNDGWWD